MKVFNHKKVKHFLLAGLSVLSMAFGALLYTAIASPVKAQADTIASTVYQTDGASVRVFKKTVTGDFQETDKKGIRFHVETGANYEIATDTLLLNTAETNNNGSYKMAEGYKSYTLVLPTRLMGGSSDLTLELEKVMKIDTTNYWYTDEEGNWESVAYIWNIPKKWYTDEFTYRGIIVSVDAEGNETLVKWTPLSTRKLSWVAKQAYNDTIDANTNYWGTAEKDETAAPYIKEFIPTYNITYSDGTTEEVLWGDKLTKADAAKTYYDENNHEPVDVTLPLDMAESCDITLTSTTESTFVFTGVEYTTAGFNVFATLPTASFANDVTLEPSTIDMVTGAGNTVTAKSVAVSVTGSGSDAISKLKIGFDYTDISNGTTLTILKTSHFYTKGVLYELEKDYEFVYNNSTWELPLGYISLGDIGKEGNNLLIQNYKESTAKGEEHNIRITFQKDILINGPITFDGSVKITRADGVTVVPITNGYYYWNQGENMILELPGDNPNDPDNLNNLWGENDGDVLTIAAGTRLIQNNGFYIFQDDISVTYSGGTFWVVEFEEKAIDASAFTAAYTRQAGDSIYIDVETAEPWADHHVKVVCNDGTLTYHHTDNVSTVDPNQIFYHGENGNQILRIYLDSYSVTGDWVTIPEGTEFWVGNRIYRLTEQVISYFVDTSEGAKNGMTWITNPNIQDVGRNNIVTMAWYGENVRYTTDVAWSTAANNRVIVDDTYIEEDGVVITGSNYTKFYYYGDTNSILEVQGTKFSETGGSVVLKKGVIIWLFNNAGSAYCGAYRLTEDIVIEVSGEAGSPMYKDVQVCALEKSMISSVTNDGSHSGEIRFNLNNKYISKMYGPARVEGSATLNGEATTSAFVYGGDGTSGYNGNTIIAFTGEDFGRAFQASAIGNVVSIAKDTKIWLSNGTGYVLVSENLNYVWNGSSYVDADVQRTVTFTSADATIKVGGVETTSTAVDTGKKVTFTVEVPTGYEIATITNATLVSEDGDVYTYTTNMLFADVTVTVICAAPITISQEDVTYFAKEGSGELRIGLNRERADIDAIMNGNYNIAHAGTTELTIGGEFVQPTQYNYYGRITDKNGVETSHQIIGLYCNVGNMVSGDSVTLKAGSTFKFGSTVLLLSGDIVGKLVGITANFDSTLATLSVDGTSLTNGETVSKFIGSGSSTIVFGWRDESNAAKYDLSVKINGEEQGNSGEYTVALEGNVTINVTITPRDFTATVTASNATVTGLNVGDNTITYGKTYNFTVAADSGYAITSVTINGAEQGTGGSYSFTASGATSIVVVTAMTEAQRRQEVISALRGSEASTYMTGLTISEDGTTISSSSATKTVAFTDKFFELLRSYGYSSVSFTISTTTTSSTGMLGGTRIQTGGSDISGNQTISTATTYTAQVKSGLFASYADDANASWTLSNVTFS